MKKELCELQRKVLWIIIFWSSFLYSSNHLGKEKPLIFPIPQQLETTEDFFFMDETVSVIVPEDMSENDLFLARFLVRELSDKYGIALKIESCTAIPKDRKVVIMGATNNPLIQQLGKENILDITTTNFAPEGYVLQVDKHKIIIAGFDEPGAFYGLQSLRQLIEGGDGTKVKGVKVQDWPNLPFRGIRLYVPGPENMAFFKRFLKDFMALYKFNKVVLEINSMRLDRHPEVNAGWIEFTEYMQYTRSNSTEGIRGEEKNSSHFDAGDGSIIEKEDVKSLVDFARSNFIEVIPEIPSLTHGYYLLTRHPELAEYPEDRWPDTYCPSNPASYELMFDVYDEYIQVIDPKMIHIGHDEWWGAPIGVCPRCRGKDYSQLFAQDVTKIHNYLTDKGIKVAMWGDYLLESVRNKGPQERISSTGVEYETPGALPPPVVIESIPKDILIFNWFWKDQDKEKELEEFGFTQIYGNFKPNISDWKERIKKVDLAGGAPSSWAATNEFNFGKDLLLDFLGSANLLWSTHTINPANLQEIVWEIVPSIRSNLKAEKQPSEDGDPVVPVDISLHFNFSADVNPFGLNLGELRSGKVEKREKIFYLPPPSSESGNLMIAAGTEGIKKSLLPNKVKGIVINEDVSSLIFLHASALPAQNQKAYFNIPNFFDSADLLGWYEIVYEDGYKETVPIQYGVNILEWNALKEKNLDHNEGETGSPQNAYCYEADAINCSSKQENPIVFFAFEWINKRFGKKIKEVNLHGSVNYQALQADYSKPVTEPMASNAILLAGISKVKKREPFKAMQ